MDPKLNPEEVAARTLRELEKKGEQTLQNPRNPAASVTDVIQNILAERMAEFKAKTGREMTYSEMRDTWG